MIWKTEHLYWKRLYKDLLEDIKNQDYRDNFVGVIGVGKKEGSLGRMTIKALSGFLNLGLYLYDIDKDSLEIAHKNLETNRCPGAKRLEDQCLTRFNKKADIETILKETELIIICIDSNADLVKKGIKLSEEYKKLAKDKTTKEQDTIFKNLLEKAPKRKEWLKGNVRPIVELADYFRKYNYRGKVVVVTEPPDVLAQIFCIYSGMPVSKVIGFNSDSFRFEKNIIDKAKIQEHLGMPQVLYAFVVGEHGAEMVPLVSQAWVNGSRLMDYFIGKPDVVQDIIEKTKYAGYEPFIKEGNYASTELSSSIAKVCSWILKNPDYIMSQSTYVALDENKDPIMPSIDEKNGIVTHARGGLFISYPLTIKNGLFVPVNQLPNPDDKMPIPFLIQGEEKDSFLRGYSNLKRTLEEIREKEWE